ncbi:MAG: signal peptidase I [Candidatus Sericytochromatia bacterium]
MEETHTPGEPAAEAEPEAQPEAKSDKPGRARKKRSRPLELIETIFVAFVLAILIRATLAEARFIPSGSMIPSLLIGDRLIVEKLSYYFNSPHRGDIVVFYPPDPYAKPLTGSARVLRWLGFTRDAAYIKRVIGLPGETLAIRNGKVLIDGKPLNEPYIKAPPLDDMPPQKIAPEHFFMMGDNRNNSRDSRVWGTMPRENVIGRTFLRFWPLNRLGIP